ncbi:MAG: GtrA family protein [Alphaproteobacteria bacterium]|nr:GtrA family protein [Alphaproteobacteria bacterium]
MRKTFEKYYQLALKLALKYKEQLLYIIFGVVTTIVNFVTYYVCARLLLIGILVSTVIAKFFSLMTAYLTNRTWVFNSNKTQKSKIFRECLTFYACRGVSALLDFVIMYVGAVWLGINDLAVKIFATIIVIILNYIMSKLIVFRKD